MKTGIASSGFTLPQAALKSAFASPAATTVIPGIRSPAQAEANRAVSELPDLPQALLLGPRKHLRVRAFWYEAK